MQKSLPVLILVFFYFSGLGQTPKTFTSSEILLQLKKLNVVGSVLYIAAHPDDENTRLLAYLANEKLYRTGYMSLTRGDGGQNLIGDEQGIDLGLIRTQELLSARRIDGAEQFFSRAYDFGFCKSSEEAIQTWGHDKILSDVVWVIRKFKPDVIITRFPEDARAGHGQHAASAIIAREAFDAAADPSRFKEQLSQGVSTWQARRLLWNTFNFGNTNTQSEDQFKLEVGGYNALLGKGYGELAALSRSQHKSQGFGVAAQRGSVLEYFVTVKGEKPVTDLMDGVDVSWSRTGNSGLADLTAEIANKFSASQPDQSLPGLIGLYQLVNKLQPGYYRDQKLKEIQNCIEAVSGIFLDATTNSQFFVEGDSIKVTLTANDRLGIATGSIGADVWGSSHALGEAKKNENVSITRNIVLTAKNPTQPYWLETPMDKGSFNVADQQKIGLPENDPPMAAFHVKIAGTDFTFRKPVRYKFTDPVRGEVYQPISILPVADLSFEKDVYLFRKSDSMQVVLNLVPNSNLAGRMGVQTRLAGDTPAPAPGKLIPVNAISKDKPQFYRVPLNQKDGSSDHSVLQATLNNLDNGTVLSDSYRRVINYEHIPSIVYQKLATTKPVYADIKIDGKTVGYIPGAGDRVPQALTEMGYRVTVLRERDIRAGSLRQFDAIVAGVRAYNTNEWMNNVYETLMEYVQQGGTLLIQYNTSNQAGPVRAKMAPYPFTVSRSRVTDEEAAVHFLLPEHPALNYPNKITAKDFEGWVQERSIYNAENIDSNYQRILGMKDAGEAEQEGSLIVAGYGKGKIVYTGLVFFRELPAGVPGAYRLFANLIASNRTGRDLKLSKLNRSEKGR
jgi:LmbE family N-acetylglucosaminyl deacetylase